MKQDKFLIGILIGIGVLIVLALALFFTRQDKADYIAENNPEGVVHNYILAILNKDYQKAYGYLADLENKPTYEDFRQSFANGMVNPGNTGADVGDAEITNDEAYVQVTIYYSNSDPFSGGYQNMDRAQLILQDGKWRISYMPYTYWDYNWYQTPIK